MKQTQTLKVLMWMKAQGPITPLQAERELGIMRLAARIGEIRKGEGVAARPVYKRLVKVRNRDGEVVQVAQYSLTPSFTMHRQYGREYVIVRNSQ